MNYLIFISYILDPRDKLEYLQFSLKTIYGDTIGCNLFINVKDALYELFKDYKSAYEASYPFNVITYESQTMTSTDVQSSSKSISMLKALFKQQKLESGIGGSKKKNELDTYLFKSALKDLDEGTFDLLRWWKLNSERFPILSSMARDVLAIPISIIISESAFSTDG